MRRFSVLSFSILLAAALPTSAQKPRARDLGIPFHGTPGPANAITDVAGVAVAGGSVARGEGEGEGEGERGGAAHAA